MKTPKLVEEKRETRGTIAKFGIFWGLIVLPFMLFKRLHRRSSSRSRLGSLLGRLPGRR